MKDVNIERNVVEEPCVGHIDLSIDIISTFSLAAQQNSYPILKSVRVSYLKHDEKPLLPLSSLTVKLTAIEGWLGEEVWHIDSLEPKTISTFKTRPIYNCHFCHDTLCHLIKARLSFSIRRLCP